MNNEQGIPSHITTGDGMFIINQEQKIIVWNEAAEEFLGYTFDEVAGRRCWEVLQGCTLNGQNICRAGGPIVTQATHGGRVRRFDLHVRHREGHTTLINLSTIALFNEEDSASPGIMHLFRPRREQPDWPGMLRIHLLGPVQVQRADGSIVKGPLWKRMKVRALLAHLAVQERQPVERDSLLELFWPELNYAAALRNLNTTVYSLRHSLEPELKSGDDTRYIFYEGGAILAGWCRGALAGYEGFSGGDSARPD